MPEGAQSLWEQARPYFNIATRNANETAKALLTRAIAVDPAFAPGWGHLSYAFVRDQVYGWNGDRDHAIRTGVELAERAYSLDPKNFDNIWSRAIALLHDGQHKTAMVLYEEALKQSPDDPILLAQMSDALVCIGQGERALDQLQRACDLMSSPPEWFAWNKAFALFGLNLLDEAIAAYRNLPDLNATAAAELVSALVARDGLAAAEPEIRDLAARFAAKGEAFLDQLPLLPFAPIQEDLRRRYEDGMCVARDLLRPPKGHTPG
ncbi:MAG: tetratricopeptide repeat protein [Inquilinus sp.]|uniref:tetratricopeptide repeat protein n=1 Tax=Inquilinus sp. TaxID=1932117 RepID=UPI003F2D08A2